MKNFKSVTMYPPAQVFWPDDASDDGSKVNICLNINYIAEYKNRSRREMELGL